jgi:hypothetical protein
VRRAGNHGREKEEKSEKKMLERWKIIDGQARSPYRFEWLRGWQAILIGILSTAGYGLAYVHELGVSLVFHKLLYNERACQEWLWRRLSTPTV